MQHEIHSADWHEAAYSCFGHKSWPHEVICPELFAEATLSEIDPQQWVANVVRRIPTWARIVLKPALQNSLEDTCQEFCSTMIEHRPDLKYDATKGSKQAFLGKILTYTHWRTIRAQEPSRVPDDIDLDLAESPHTNPLVIAEQNELIHLGIEWMSTLPRNQCVAVTETIKGTQCSCPTKSVHYVRCCRAIKRLRSFADARMLRDAPLCSRRRRTRRCRIPNRCMMRRAT
jgi:hypothetical protein